MRILKTILYSLLAVVALAILAFSGFFLWHAIPKVQEAPPEVLSTDAIFHEEEIPAPQPEPTPLPAPETPPAEEPPTEEPPAEEEPEEAPPIDGEVSPRALAEAYLQTMTAEEKIWQLFITTPEAITDVALATRAGEATKTALQTYPVGGLCYFAGNLEDQQQAAALLTNTQSFAKTPLFLCIDEEGGQVSRAGANEDLNVTHFPAAAEFGESHDTEGVRQMGATLAQELQALGFNVNFAPVADVITNPNNEEIGNRAYSTDPAIAADLVAAMVDGLQHNGMIACLKHFPGHGSTEADSHDGESISDRTLDQLRETEWVPFRAGIDQGVMFVMLSHLSNTNLSSLPADLSPQVVSYLRKELDFSGLILTDSHQMGAITDHYTSGEAAVLALQAGVDVILMPDDLQAAFDGVKTAVDSGTVTQERIDESVLRILTIKYAFGIMEG